MKKHISKIIFVDDDFVSEFKSKDLSGYHNFIKTPLDTQIIALSSQSDIDELLDQNVLSPAQIRAGNVVVKSPCRENYFVSLPDLSEDIAVRKYDIFNAFCIALGAKRVFIEHFEFSDYNVSLTENINVNVVVKSPVVGGNADLNKNKNSRTADAVKKKVGVTSVAEGGSPDIEKARFIINKYGLQYDSLFESLLESCELTNNRLLSKEFLIDTSKDLEKIIDSSLKAKLNVVSRIYSLSGGGDTSTVAVETNLVAFQLKMKVEF